MSRTLLLLFVLLLTLATTAAAQSSQRQMNFRHVELRVTLAFANSNEVTKDLRVELTDSFGVSLQELRSDREGKVSFRNVPPGDYRIVVKGENVEESRGTIFTVFGVSSAHSEMVTVYAKREDGAKPTANAAVSMASLKVPQKAREELERGSTELAAGRLAEARKYFERAIEIYPEYAGAYNNLGVIHMQEGNRADGKRAFERALELDPESTRVYLNLARIYDVERNFAEIDRLLTKYVALHPLHAEALMLLSKAQVAIGKLDLALENCRKIHTLPHKDQPRAHLLAARILSHRMLKDEATKEYTTFIMEAPDDANVPEAKRMLETLQGAAAGPR